MTVILFPRLDPIAVDQLFDEIVETGDTNPYSDSSKQLPTRANYGATGGTRIAVDDLLEIRRRIVELATTSGFPKKSSNTEKARFDSKVAAWLASEKIFCSGESLRDDVWAFLTTVLVPDIVVWRFGKARGRFHGGVRNTLQRLWFRSQVLDRGMENEQKWELLEKLTEDALVQITERPSIGANAKLALPLAEAWIRASQKFGRNKMEDVMRSAIIELRLLNEIRNLSILDTRVLDNLLDEVFDHTALALKVVPLNASAIPTADNLIDVPNGITKKDNFTSKLRKKSLSIWRKN